MKQKLSSLCWVLLLFLPGCTAAGSTATPTPQVVPSAGESEVDLTSSFAKITLQGSPICYDGIARMGTEITIQNIGQTDAGEFVVSTPNSEQKVDGLKAGESIIVWFEGYTMGESPDIRIDAGDQIVEIREDNNLYNNPIPVPTLPRPCETPSP